MYIEEYEFVFLYFLSMKNNIAIINETKRRK